MARNLTTSNGVAIVKEYDDNTNISTQTYNELEDLRGPSTKFYDLTGNKC